MAKENTVLNNSFSDFRSKGDFDDESSKTPGPDDHLEALKKISSDSNSFRSFTMRMIIKLTGSFFQSFLTIFACVVYVVNTYYEDDEMLAFQILEIVIAALFTVDYVWGMSIATDKKKFLTNPLNVLDLITILPVYVSILNSSTSSSSLMFTRFIRVIRVIRILRLYRLFTVILT